MCKTKQVNISTIKKCEDFKTRRPRINGKDKSYNMGKLSMPMRWRLTGMLNAGLSINEVARRMNVHKNTVQKWKAGRLAGGDLNDLPRSGRPRITSANQDASIINHVENNRSFTGDFKSSVSIIFVNV